MQQVLKLVEEKIVNNFKKSTPIYFYHELT